MIHDKIRFIPLNILQYNFDFKTMAVSVSMIWLGLGVAESYLNSEFNPTILSISWMGPI